MQDIKTIIISNLLDIKLFLYFQGESVIKYLMRVDDMYLLMSSNSDIRKWEIK